MKEKNILFETENLWCKKEGTGIAVMVHATGCSFKIGQKNDLKSSIQFMNRLENYPQNIALLVPVADRYKLRIKKK